MKLRMLIAMFAAVVGAASPGYAQKVDTVSGYAEWHKDHALIVDGQRITVNGSTRFSGDATADLSRFPLGAEVKVQGTRGPDGALLARSIEAKRNGVGLLERSVRDAADEAERQWLNAEAVEDPDDPEAGGRILQRGRQVARVRRIVDRLVPPYLSPAEFRVYVIENDDWNAFAMANGSIWVFTGLEEAMSDDELAVVLGHELAHITHEHSRRDSKKSLWVNALAAAISFAAEHIENETARTAVQAAAFVSALATDSAFGRQSEDQADRVGLRYAFEGGFDPSKAPGVWQRFEEKYGSGNRIVNFFLSDHSRTPVRRAHLEQQVAWNYRPGLDRPALAYATRPAAPQHASADAVDLAPRGRATENNVEVAYERQGLPGQVSVKDTALRAVRERKRSGGPDHRQ